VKRSSGALCSPRVARDVKLTGCPTAKLSACEPPLALPFVAAIEAAAPPVATTRVTSDGTIQAATAGARRGGAALARL